MEGTDCFYANKSIHDKGKSEQRFGQRIAKFTRPSMDNFRSKASLTGMVPVSKYTYHKYDTFYIYKYIKTLWVFIYMHVLFQNSCTNMRPYAPWNRGASVEQGAVPSSTLYLRKVRDREIWCSLSISRVHPVFP